MFPTFDTQSGQHLVNPPILAFVKHDPKPAVSLAMALNGGPLRLEKLRARDAATIP